MQFLFGFVVVRFGFGFFIEPKKKLHWKVQVLHHCNLQPSKRNLVNTVEVVLICDV